MRLRAARNGFTLIEALVVLAVVGLVSALNYPMVDRSIGTLQERQARAQVLGALSGARDEAIRTAAPVDLGAMPGNRGLVWASHSAPIGEGLSVRLSTAPIRFYPDGSASAGQVELDARSGRTLWSIGRYDGHAEEVSPDGT